MKKVKSIKNILVPVDFSDTSKLLAEYANIFGVNFGAKIHVIHVVEDFGKYARLSVPHISIDKVTKEIYEAAKKSLEKFCIESFKKNVKFESILSEGEAHEEILKAAKKRNIDIIIIGTHGSSGLDKIFFGSTADRVLRGAKCPVMTVSL
jgi:nucleotide-binding universal stress UspA family protein